MGQDMGRGILTLKAVLRHCFLSRHIGQRQSCGHTFLQKGRECYWYLVPRRKENGKKIGIPHEFQVEDNRAQYLTDREFILMNKKS